MSLTRRNLLKFLGIGVASTLVPELIAQERIEEEAQEQCRSHLDDAPEYAYQTVMFEEPFTIQGDETLKLSYTMSGSKTDLIPELWAAESLKILQESMITSTLVRRDFSDKIQECSDSVHVNIEREIMKGVRNVSKNS